MTTITITPCYERIQLWCPFCKRHIKDGVRTVAVNYTLKGKFICHLLGELVFTECCDKGIHAQMFFETPTEQESAVESVASTLEYLSLDVFKQTHILKRASRRIRKSIQIEQHQNSYTFDDLLDAKLQRKFGSNLMDFRKYPDEDIGNVLH